MTAPLTAPQNAATAQPAQDTAEATKPTVRLPVAEGFDYIGMIKRIRRDTGRL